MVGEQNFLRGNLKGNPHLKYGCKLFPDSLFLNSCGTTVPSFIVFSVFDVLLLSLGMDLLLVTVFPQSVNEKRPEII